MRTGDPQREATVKMAVVVYHPIKDFLCLKAEAFAYLVPLQKLLRQFEKRSRE